jgi:5-methylcytosine-specific restriction endonuclease McrA
LKSDGTVNRRRTWHDPCVAAYKLAAESFSQRAACFERDKGMCACCGEDAAKVVGYRDGGRSVWYEQNCSAPFSQLIEIKGWDADHIVPLWSVDRDLPHAELIRFWSMDNLQTLCSPCHKRKSANEAKVRAEIAAEKKSGPRMRQLPLAIGAPA